MARDCSGARLCCIIVSSLAVGPKRQRQRQRGGGANALLLEGLETAAVGLRSCGLGLSANEGAAGRKTAGRKSRGAGPRGLVVGCDAAEMVSVRASGESGHPVC